MFEIEKLKKDGSLQRLGNLANHRFQKKTRAVLQIRQIHDSEEVTMVDRKMACRIANFYRVRFVKFLLDREN